MIRILLFLLVAVSTPALAREWFVSTSGNDSSGTGSLASPFRTVKHVLSTSLNMTSPGDIITLRAGTYNECDVRLRKPLTLRSYGSERAHIHCDMNVSNSVTIQIDTGASGSQLSQLEISGGQYYGVMLQTDWDPDPCCQNASGPSNVVLQDLKIHDTGRDGVKITPKSNHVTIRNNEIWNTGAIYPPGTILDNRNADGIDSVNVSFLLIEDNYIHDISTTGLYFKGGSSDVTVQRNRIENTGMAGILVGFDTSVEFFDLSINPQFYESIRGTVRNNIIRNTVWEGIGLYSAKDAVVANNTIINTAQDGHAALYFGVPAQDWDPAAGRPPSVNPIIRNNLVIQYGGKCIEIRYWNDMGGVSGLSGNPNTDWNGYTNSNGACVFRDARPGSPINGNATLSQWIAYENTDTHSLYAAFTVDSSGHLMAGSPAIDAGTVIPQVTDDFDKQQRYAPYDIGADEVAAPPPNEIFGSGFD
ncbi:MAG TPA: right-handed parallel beta-helix repeat-containing protein [Dokdonella sp.]|nr:right-handed parallel beta-helix repeat-containing protein [Dokdonella sp.]